jgi:hypothetical protein
MAVPWTVSDAAAFLALADDGARLAFVQSLLAVTPDAYSYAIASTFLVDFHLGNALFCQELDFTAAQTAFLCESMGRLLSGASGAALDTDFDALRLRLIRALRAMFLARRELFSYAQVQDALRHAASCLIQPLRLIVWAFQRPPDVEEFLELRKVWGPPPLCALDECDRGPRFVDPPAALGGAPADVAAAVDAYWDALRAQAEERCRALEERISALAELAAV